MLRFRVTHGERFRFDSWAKSEINSRCNSEKKKVLWFLVFLKGSKLCRFQ